MGKPLLVKLLCVNRNSGANLKYLYLTMDPLKFQVVKSIVLGTPQPHVGQLPMRVPFGSGAPSPAFRDINITSMGLPFYSLSLIQRRI